uniref:Solute carrier family 40 protein n=1 Tax=Caenorhabditis tropicalis TaxID=1561998 RepID=A0A1I7U9E1_9PELO
MYNTGLWITNSTAVSLLIERWLATRRSSSYEQEPVKTGIMMAILQTAQASLPYAGQMSAVVGFSFQLTARITFHYLYRQNKNRFVSRDEMVLTKTNVNGRVFQ